MPSMIMLLQTELHCRLKPFLYYMHNVHNGHHDLDRINAKKNNETIFSFIFQNRSAIGVIEHKREIRGINDKH